MPGHRGRGSAPRDPPAAAADRSHPYRRPGARNSDGCPGTKSRTCSESQSAGVDTCRRWAGWLRRRWLAPLPGRSSPPPGRSSPPPARSPPPRDGLPDEPRGPTLTCMAEAALTPRAEQTRAAIIEAAPVLRLTLTDVLSIVDDMRP